MKKPPTTLSPRHLQAIVAVARTGSVHSAARALEIPQPALSRLLAGAERLLGVPLFERSRSGTRPTAIGERVLKQTAFALHALEGVAETAQHRLPVVRLGCIPRVMHVLIPHLLTQLSGGSAEFQLHVAVGTSNEMAGELEAARVDFVIARRSALSARTVMDVEAEKLYSERTVLVCGRGNSSVPKKLRCHLRHVVGLPWVLPKRGFYSRDALDVVISRLGLQPIVPVIESNSFESNLSMVAATNFVTMAPEFAARRLERLHLVRVISITPDLGDSPVMLQYAATQRTHPAFQEFRAAAISASRKVLSQSP